MSKALGKPRPRPIATVISPLEPVGYVSLPDGFMVPAVWDGHDADPPDVGQRVGVTLRQRDDPIGPNTVARCTPLYEGAVDV